MGKMKTDSGCLWFFVLAAGAGLVALAAGASMQGAATWALVAGAAGVFAFWAAALLALALFALALVNR